MAKRLRTVNNSDPIFAKLLAETNQQESTRTQLIAALEEKFDNRCVLLFFTSFWHPVIISNADADMIEGVLQKSDLSRGLMVVINSPGGDALAAERIINVCRAYTGGNFEAVVPKMAKSAATMICLGARKIWMSKTSELGPVDPQVLRENRITSAYSIIKSYEELLQTAVQTSGHIEPYLQQLSVYDPSEIKDLRTLLELSASIAVTALQTGMLNGHDEDSLRGKIKPFLDPEVTRSHGRMINLDAVQNCGLAIQEIPLQSEVWSLLWELYIRADWYVTNRCSKLVQTTKHQFEVPLPPQ